MSMEGIQKLIELAKADGGKFFVIDEKGNPQLVILTVEQYESLLLRKVQNQTESIEEINKKIIEAQKQEQILMRQEEQDRLKSEVIDSTFSFELPFRQGSAGLEDY